MSVYREGQASACDTKLTSEDAPPSQARCSSETLLAREDICAVIVTYFPEPECALNLSRIVSQVGKVLIVDNGSSAQSLQPIKALAPQFGSVIVSLGENLGVAAALNIGLRFARKQGYRWLATFDQDSRAWPQMIDEMAGALRCFPHPERVGVIAACPVDPDSGVSITYPVADASGSNWRVVPCAGTSGNLVNVRVACEVGGFDESLFIDYVDFEFCLRLRGRGYQVLEAPLAKFRHSLGHVEFRRFVFMRVPITHHTAVRHYYKSRNRLIIWRSYWRREPTWVRRDIAWFLFEVLFIVLYEKQTFAKLRMMVRGLHDAWGNIGGAYPRQH